MDVFRSFATDEKKENAGVWQKIGDSRFLIARANNKQYSRLLDKLLSENQKALEEKGPTGEPSEAAQALDKSLLVDVLANTVLLGWENVQYDGEDLDYSVENAKRLLAIKDFRAVIQGHASSFEAYKAYQEEQQAKN